MSRGERVFRFYVNNELTVGVLSVARKMSLQS